MNALRNQFVPLACITAAALCFASCSQDTKLKELNEQVHKLYGEEKYSAAASAAEIALAEAERRFVPDHQIELIVPLNNLAGLYRLLGRPGDAAGIYVRMIEIYRLENITENEQVPTYHDLATVSIETGDFKTAEEFEKRVLEVKERQISENAEGMSQIDLAPTLNNLGYVYLAQKNAAMAEPLLLRAASLVEENLGPGHPYYDISLSHLADLYRRIKLWDKAERILKRLIEVRVARLGIGSPDVARGWNNLGVLYKDAGRFDEAEKAYRTALDFFSKSAVQYPADEATIQANLAEVLVLVGKQQESSQVQAPLAQ